MNKFVLVTLFFSTSIFALSSAKVLMTCGVVKKARSAKLLRRLEPSLFGINSKYVLLTKFENPIGYSEVHNKDTYTSNTFVSSDMHKTFTYFSWKDKFLKLRKSIKREMTR